MVEDEATIPPFYDMGPLGSWTIWGNFNDMIEPLITRVYDDKADFPPDLLNDDKPLFQPDLSSTQTESGFCSSIITVLLISLLRLYKIRWNLISQNA